MVPARAACLHVQQAMIIRGRCLEDSRSTPIALALAVSWWRSEGYIQ